jgi:hypothetical protein
MRRVIYTHDMEPITVVELHGWAEEFLVRQGRVCLAVVKPLAKVHWDMPPDMKIAMDLMQVTLTAERLYYRGQEHLMLFTSDEESALLLKAAFLPGQQSSLQERERAAFAKGFLEALHRLGR